jgi:ABC-2 type transport system ATP-binding protein
MAVIETEKLTKFYGPHRGIVDVDLAVEEGEIYGFLGPNGAGKTTTIRLFLDLIRPTSGRARVFGIETTADPVAIHRRVGYLPGEFALFDRLTGGETIEYFANLRGGGDPLYQADLVARFDLDPSRRFKEYSKGNKQKVGLVIALQHRPDLLILDEPTSGLDPLVQQTFFQLLRETVAEGRSAFLSSHILGEVEKTCDRVAIIREVASSRSTGSRRSRPGPPPGRAPVHRARPCVGVLVAARRERRRRDRGRAADARDRLHGAHRRGGRRPRPRRLRDQGAEP